MPPAHALSRSTLDALLHHLEGFRSSSPELLTFLKLSMVSRVAFARVDEFLNAGREDLFSVWKFFKTQALLNPEDYYRPELLEGVDLSKGAEAVKDGLTRFLLWNQGDVLPVMPRASGPFARPKHAEPPGVKVPPEPAELAPGRKPVRKEVMPEAAGVVTEAVGVVPEGAKVIEVVPEGAKVIEAMPEGTNEVLPVALLTRRRAKREIATTDSAAAAAAPHAKKIKTRVKKLKERVEVLPDGEAIPVIDSEATQHIEPKKAKNKTTAIRVSALANNPPIEIIDLVDSDKEMPNPSSFINDYDYFPPLPTSLAKVPAQQVHVPPPAQRVYTPPPAQRVYAQPPAQRAHVPTPMPTMHTPPMHAPPMHMPPMHMPPMHMPSMHMPSTHMPPMHMLPTHMPSMHMPPSGEYTGLSLEDAISISFVVSQTRATVTYAREIFFKHHRGLNATIVELHQYNTDLEEARMFDKARLESESSAVDDKKRAEFHRVETLQTSEAVTIFKDSEFIRNVSSWQSWLQLGSTELAQEGLSIREAMIKLLDLELKAIKWYKAASRAYVRWRCSQIQTWDLVTFEREIRDISSAMFASPSEDAGAPEIFLKCLDNEQQQNPEDDDIVVVVTTTKIMSAFDDAAGSPMLSAEMLASPANGAAVA